MLPSLALIASIATAPRVLGEAQLDAVEPEGLLVLLEQRVLRLRQDPHHPSPVQTVNLTHDGQAAHELRDEAEL